MRAMILAAGRGERMRPLTDHTPKPLLSVGGKPLIVWHLERLARAGIGRVVINCAHLGAKIPAVLGNGTAWGLEIAYSQEPPGALETAGGIARALPLLGADPFLVLNGDVFFDAPPALLTDNACFQAFAASDRMAHLALTQNPPHHSAGDFVLVAGEVSNPATNTATLTFTGIGLYKPALFAGIAPDRPARLAPLLRAAADRGLVSGERYRGRWVDVGTPERLRELDASLRAIPQT
ncbi:MAG: nucleotidyltransferase family protein [Zoogloeaceae bacterium]|nr:nucleotidyltransferase family protein [Zoogloeaceae bacterium]